MTTVAIMQPTFLPWMGYFALMRSADDFVFLDDVQFSKKSWQSRNLIKGPNGPITLSLSVSRDQSKPLICDVSLAQTGFEEKLFKTIVASLGKAPFFTQVAPLVETAFKAANGSLSRLNRSLIESMSKLLGLTCRCHLASALGIDGGGKADRLLQITRTLGAQTYLSPVGSLDYLACHDPFAKSEVALRFIDFQHPSYPQLFGPFQSHMAILDVVSNIGPDAALALIDKHLKPTMTLRQLQSSLYENL